MSIKNALAAGLGAVLMVFAVSALAQETKAEEQKPGRACCMAACTQHASGDDATQRHGTGMMRCSLTGQTMETCCCIHREGKLHCTLADKDVESCCCGPERDETGATDKTSKTDQPNNGAADHTVTNE